MGSIPTPNFAFPGQWLRLGTQQLHIIVRPGVQAPRFQHVALNVEDFAAVYWTARERKLHDESAFFSKMYELPDGAVQMYVREPAGNLVEVDWPDARTLNARIQEDLIPLSATPADRRLPDRDALSGPARRRSRRGGRLPSPRDERDVT